MRFPIILLLLTSAASAQVATDEHALDALPSAVPAAPAKPAAGAPPHARTRPVVKPRSPTKPRALPPATMPAAPPANPVLAPPPFVMPAHPPPPPPSVLVRKDAPGAATPIPGGTRITFGAGVADINSATLAAIRAIAARAAANPGLTLAVTAWAPGTVDDPSTPRRLALDRALAVRAVLINAGIVSERIRTVAKGALDPGTGPIDRADLLELPSAH